jgi:hypothetical protein
MERQGKKETENGLSFWVGKRRRSPMKFVKPEVT